MNEAGRTPSPGEAPSLATTRAARRSSPNSGVIDGREHVFDLHAWDEFWS